MERGQGGRRGRGVGPRQGRRGRGRVHVYVFPRAGERGGPSHGPAWGEEPWEVHGPDNLRAPGARPERAWVVGVAERNRPYAGAISD
jgi:hypothetical protein